MNGNTIKAKELLREGGYTCVLCKCDDIRTSTHRGVRPLLGFHESDDTFDGYSAADKVVGAGAAYMYVLLGVAELWADVISEKAMAVLECYGIRYFAENIVPQIVNRTGDGFCPIEASVTDAATPTEALKMIRQTLKNLS